MQEVGLRTEADEVLLAWAAENDRLLITHDASTIPGAAYARVLEGQTMPGVVVIRSNLPIGQTIEHVLELAGASYENEWENQVVYWPL
jgi:hypothetical protein